MAILSFVVTPLWGSLLPFSIGIQIAAALLLVLLAGFTSAHNQLVMIANATIAGISVLLLESYAVIQHVPNAINGTQLFIAREAGVLLMLAALYWSIKTLRAMMSGKIGHPDSPLEFDEKMPEVLVRPTESERDVYDG